MKRSHESKPKKGRADAQMTGLAGELFVAAELLKRGLQASITFGHAKAIDLHAYNPDTKRSFVVQVKSLRSENYFLIGHKSVESSQLYIFVLLNKPAEPVRYFIVPGEDMHLRPDKFGKWFTADKMPGIHSDLLDELGYENRWEIFHDPSAVSQTVAADAASRLA